MNDERRGPAWPRLSDVAFTEHYGSMPLVMASDSRRIAMMAFPAYQCGTGFTCLPSVWAMRPPQMGVSTTTQVIIILVVLMLLTHGYPWVP